MPFIIINCCRKKLIFCLSKFQWRRLHSFVSEKNKKLLFKGKIVDYSDRKCANSNNNKILLLSSAIITISPKFLFFFCHFFTLLYFFIISLTNNRNLSRSLHTYTREDVLPTHAQAFFHHTKDSIYVRLKFVSSYK